MDIFITGGSGFVGTHVTEDFLNAGHRVTAVGQRPSHPRFHHDSYRYISADTSEPGEWQNFVTDADAVVNLAGRTIFNRWTAAYKRVIHDSRVLTTRNLVDALDPDRGTILCSASAVGFYGDRGEDVLTEDEPAGSDFLADVGVDWEAEARLAEAKNSRVVLARFGIVLGRKGGAMEKMVPAFRYLLGGPLGDGMQWFPWIHMDDVVGAIRFVIEHEDMDGPVNFCAPNPVRNLDLARTLGAVLKRPAFMPAPAFMIRLILGELGSTFLTSSRAVPAKLVDHGFAFEYPELREALVDLVSPS